MRNSDIQDVVSPPEPFHLAEIPARRTTEQITVSELNSLLRQAVQALRIVQTAPNDALTDVGATGDIRSSLEFLWRCRFELMAFHPVFPLLEALNTSEPLPLNGESHLSITRGFARFLDQFCYELVDNYRSIIERKRGRFGWLAEETTRGIEFLEDPIEPAPEVQEIRVANREQLEAACHIENREGSVYPPLILHETIEHAKRLLSLINLDILESQIVVEMNRVRNVVKDQSLMVVIGDGDRSFHALNPELSDFIGIERDQAIPVDPYDRLYEFADDLSKESRKFLLAILDNNGRLPFGAMAEALGETIDDPREKHKSAAREINKKLKQGGYPFEVRQNDLCSIIALKTNPGQLAILA